jgi:hypothetical protein
MPKAKGKTIPAVAVTAPPAALNPSRFKVDAANVARAALEAKTTLHRIHQEVHGALQLNPGVGNARFSPITDAKGNAIPTIYAGETFECAAMESVFHDVSYEPGLKTYDKAKLAGQVHSVFGTEEVLVLAYFFYKSFTGQDRLDLPLHPHRRLPPLARLWLDLL